MPHDRKNNNKMQCLILTPIGGPRGYPGSGGVPLPDGRGSVKAGGASLTGGGAVCGGFSVVSRVRGGRGRRRDRSVPGIWRAVRAWPPASRPGIRRGRWTRGARHAPVSTGRRPFFRAKPFWWLFGAAIRPPVRRRVGGIALHFRCAGRRRGRACHGDFERAKPIWYGARVSILLTE